MHDVSATRISFQSTVTRSVLAACKRLRASRNLTCELASSRFRSRAIPKRISDRWISELHLHRPDVDLYSFITRAHALKSTIRCSGYLTVTEPSIKPSYTSTLASFRPGNRMLKCCTCRVCAIEGFAPMIEPALESNVKPYIITVAPLVTDN
jgi:hypothetical protein